MKEVDDTVGGFREQADENVTKSSKFMKSGADRRVGIEKVEKGGKSIQVSINPREKRRVNFVFCFRIKMNNDRYNQGGYNNQQGGYPQGGYDSQGGYNQGGYVQGGYNTQSGYNTQGGYDPNQGYNQQGFGNNQGGMSQGYPANNQGMGMNQQGMMYNSQNQQGGQVYMGDPNFSGQGKRSICAPRAPKMQARSTLAISLGNPQKKDHYHLSFVVGSCDRLMVALITFDSVRANNLSALSLSELPPSCSHSPPIVACSTRFTRTSAA